MVGFILVGVFYYLMNAPTYDTNPADFLLILDSYSVQAQGDK